MTAKTAMHCKTFMDMLIGFMLTLNGPQVSRTATKMSTPSELGRWARIMYIAL